MIAEQIEQFSGGRFAALRVARPGCWPIQAVVPEVGLGLMIPLLDLILG